MDPLETQLKAELFEFEHEHYVEGQRRALKLMFGPPGSHGTYRNVLDCACGDGVGLQWFRDNFFYPQNTYGFELNPRKADKAKEINSNVIVGDMHDMGCYGDDFFGYIWSSHSLEHAYNPLDTLKEFKRILEPSGTLLLVVPFPDVGPKDVHCGQIDLHTDQQTPDRFLAKITEAGFDVLEWKTDSFREPEIWVKAVKRI